MEATEAAGFVTPLPLALAQSLSNRHECDVIVTLGRHGMACAARGDATWYLPAVPTEVRDVCGAGDTVIAVLAAAIADGLTLFQACKLATRTASNQVASIGITVQSTNTGGRYEKTS